MLANISVAENFSNNYRCGNRSDKIGNRNQDSNVHQFHLLASLVIHSISTASSAVIASPLGQAHVPGAGAALTGIITETGKIAFSF
jgi:hypothetical protein